MHCAQGTQLRRSTPRVHGKGTSCHYLLLRASRVAERPAGWRQ